MICFIREENRFIYLNFNINNNVKMYDIYHIIIARQMIISNFKAVNLQRIF